MTMKYLILLPILLIMGCTERRPTCHYVVEIFPRNCTCENDTISFRAGRVYMEYDQLMVDRKVRAEDIRSYQILSVTDCK